MNEYIVPIIVALVAAAPGVWALIQSRRKTKAEAADIITDSALELLEQNKKDMAEIRLELKEVKAENKVLKDTMDSIQNELKSVKVENILLKEEIAEVKSENKILRAWAKDLVNQVVEHGGTPCPEPILPKTYPRKEK